MKNLEALNSLYTRRSIKSYKAEQISKEELDAILKAGTYAPTGRGKQSPVIVVVQDRETVKKLSRMNAEILGGEGDPFYGAPTVLVVFGNPEHPTWMEDGSLVMGNMLNAAHFIGIGGCWIHRAKQMFETEEGKQLMRQWGVPENHIGIANCILGYEDNPPKPQAERKEGYIIRP